MGRTPHESPPKKKKIFYFFFDGLGFWRPLKFFPQGPNQTEKKTLSIPCNFFCQWKNLAQSTKFGQNHSVIGEDKFLEAASKNDLFGKKNVDFLVSLKILAQPTKTAPNQQFAGQTEKIGPSNQRRLATSNHLCPLPSNPPPVPRGRLGRRPDRPCASVHPTIPDDPPPGERRGPSAGPASPGYSSGGCPSSRARRSTATPPPGAGCGSPCRRSPSGPPNAPSAPGSTAGSSG